MSTSTASERRRRRSACRARPRGDRRSRHCDGTAPVPGVWYVGLRWLTHRASGTLPGFPEDAATVAEAVRAQLRG